MCECLVGLGHAVHLLLAFEGLNQLEELELSYKENAFSLLYASLSYCTPNKNKYAYKLDAKVKKDGPPDRSR